jgi:formylmethanofuran dehydrogenase subunit B
VLVIGSSSLIPAELVAAMREHPCAVVGPRASAGPLARAAVVIDTGIAGIHEDGLAVRMDDVPLPLRAVVTTDAPATVSVTRQLRARVSRVY